MNAHRAGRRGAPRPIQRIEIDGRLLAVFDDVLDKTVQEELERELRHLGFDRAERDSAATAHIRQLVANFDLESIRGHHVFRQARALLASTFAGERFTCVRAYCNQIAYGDMLFPHRDAQEPGSRSVTALVYGNTSWEKAWGGETIFYDDAGEVAAAVLPRPGRIVLFRGAIEHRASAPQRICYEPRYTLAFKFREIGSRRR
jgi:SM-20-related protein